MHLIDRLPSMRRIALARMIYKIVNLIYDKKNRIIKRDGVYYNIDLTEGIDLSLFIFGNFQKHVYNNKFSQLSPEKKS